MNALLSKQHKCILVDDTILSLRKLNSNCCLVGPPHSGKKTIVKYAFHNIVFVNKDTLTKPYFEKLLQQKPFKEIQYICIHDVDTTKKAKQISSIVDAYIGSFIFIVASHSVPISPLITSRFVTITVKPPMYSQIKSKFPHAPEALIEKYKWPHDLLIALDLHKHNQNVDEIYSWKTLVHTLCTELVELSFEAVRKYLYKLMLYPISFSLFYKYAVDIYVKQIGNKSVIHEIIQLAAKYEHRSKLGNKDIYHAEAFLLHIKDLLHYGETN